MAGELKRSNFTRLITILRKRRPITNAQTNAMPSLRRQHDYMRSFYRCLTETKHPILAMLCPMLIFLFTFFRRHALQSSDVIDERAVSQYVSPFSSFMLTICYDTFRFYTHRRVLICCPITLHVLSYSLGFVFYPIYACTPHYRNTQFTTARVPLSV